MSAPSRSGSPAAKKARYEWHEQFTDPLLDIVIRSNDGILFRASSHALKRESSLFKGMLTSIPNVYQSEDDAILLDYSAAAIALFLDDYTASSTRSPPQETPLVLLQEHCNLIGYLCADRLFPPATSVFKSACDARPVEWLHLASRNNDLLAASEALTRCELARPTLTLGNVHGIVRKTRLTWRYPLLKCLVTLPTHGGYQLGTVNASLSWPDSHRIARFNADVSSAEAERLSGDWSVHD